LFVITLPHRLQIAKQQDIAEVKTSVTLELRILVLALACGVLPQAITVATAQDSQQMTGPAAETTKPGTADGSRNPNSWSPALTGERRPLYRLHKSDVVDIKFTFEPEFDEEVSVQPRDAIHKAYAPVLRDPEINVFLKEFEPPYFHRWGRGRKAGEI
jgi:hypothetical protein